MITDVSSVARAARRLDVSSTLRSFAAPGVFLLLILQAWTLLSPAKPDPYSSDFGSASEIAWPMLAITVAGALLSLVLTVLADGAARQPWRPLSMAIGMLAGAVSVTIKTLIVLALIGAVIIGIADPPSLDEMLEQLGISPLSEQLLGSILVLLFGILLPLWLLDRAVEVEGELAGDTPRPVLLGDISGHSFWARLAYTMGLPSSLWRFGALIALGFWLFLLARGLIYASFAAFQGQAQEPGYSSGFDGGYSEPAFDGDLTKLLITLGIFAGLFVLGHILFALAKRLAARRVWAPEKKDGRAPILFLRSFKDDQFSFHRSWFDPGGRWLDLWSFRRNVDELLIDEFEGYGPVLALGKPDEKNTPFGAARRYVTHEDWQAVVRDAAERALAIVVCTGRTPGLLWEYGYLRDNNLLHKTLFLFPAAERDSPVVRESLNIFGQAMGETEAATVTGGALIAWTRGEQGEETIVSSRPRGPAYLVALRAFIQDRARTAGQRVGDGRPRWILLGVLAVVSVGVIVAALAVGLDSTGAFEAFDDF